MLRAFYTAWSFVLSFIHNRLIAAAPGRKKTIIFSIKTVENDLKREKYLLFVLAFRYFCRNINKRQTVNNSELENIFYLRQRLLRIPLSIKRSGRNAVNSHKRRLV